MKNRRYLVSLFMVLVLITGCGSSSQVDREQEKWRRLGIKDYRITILFYENFANNIQTQREVTVRNDQFVNSFYISERCPAFILADVYTVDDLFAVARGTTIASMDMLDEYDDCVQNLEFDENYGYPRSMKIDCLLALDENHPCKVISFQVLQ